MATNLKRQTRFGPLRGPVSAAAIALLVAGCATTPTPKSRPAVQINIQEDVGFTIIEEGRVSESVRADYDAALQKLEQGDLANGIAMLESIIANAPHLAAPRIDLGIAQHRAGDLEAAEGSLQKALDLSPGHPIAHNELGIVYRKTGRFDKARDHYEAALEIYPGYHYARRNLAVLCDLYLADLGCALANYEAYMATVPNDDEASMWIADLRLRMNQGGN